MAGYSSIFKFLIALCSAQKTGGSCELRCKSSSSVYSRDNARNHANSRGVEPAASFFIWSETNAEHQRQ
nr:MAG TPA: hypothetical protein [Caudoviricetes sp.]